MVFKIFKCSFEFLKIITEKRDGNCHVLADPRWEMLLKAVEQQLGTAKRVQESRWEMPKGYWAASG
jgi:hypothetical protein